MIKAVIFDFDGTLCDTWDSNIRVCKKFNIDFSPADFRDCHNSNKLKNQMFNFAKQRVKDLFIAYKEEADSDKLFPLKNELEKLKKKYKLFIVSGNTELAINEYLKLGKWSCFFEKVVGVETCDSKPEIFKNLFYEFDLNPEECIFITDTLGDLIDSKEVGIKTIAVTWGYHKEKRLKKGNPTKIINNFNEIADTVDEFMDVKKV